MCHAELNCNMVQYEPLEYEEEVEVEVEEEGTYIESSHLISSHLITPSGIITYHTSHTHTHSQYPRPTGWLVGCMKAVY